jgi:hypothetical protein
MLEIIARPFGLGKKGKESFLWKETERAFSFRQKERIFSLDSRSIVVLHYGCHNLLESAFSLAGRSHFLRDWCPDKEVVEKKATVVLGLGQCTFHATYLFFSPPYPIIFFYMANAVVKYSSNSIWFHEPELELAD